MNNRVQMFPPNGGNPIEVSSDSVATMLNRGWSETDKSKDAPKSKGETKKGLENGES